MRSLLANKIIATLVLIMLFIGVVGFFVSPALAQFTDPVPTSGNDAFNVQAGSFGGILVAYDGSLISFITRVVQYLLGFLGIVVVLILIYGGYIWMTSGGDADKVEKAKKIIRNAIIGLIIILTSYAIVSMIFNTFYGTGGGTGPRPCPGCDGDTWRSGIGVGPIESVYPAPRQTDVPINTLIAVTFKEGVDATSICNDQNGDGVCGGVGTIDSGEAMTGNIKICELVEAVAGNNVSYNCATDGDFKVSDFADSTVSQNGRTFVIKPSHYLGLEDFADRNFYIVLTDGIKSKASGESIFTNWRGTEYGWSFTTNGELDLDPPEIVSTNEALNSDPMSGVFPNPDGSPDGYSQSAAPKSLQLIIGKIANPTARVLPSASAPSANQVESAQATLVGTYGGTVTGQVNVRIDSGSGELVVNWPEPQDDDRITNNEQVGQTEFALGGSGLIIKFSQVPQRGQSWKFDVAAAVDGDRLQVVKGQQVIKEYIFSAVADSASIPPDATCAQLAARIATDLPLLFRHINPATCQLDTVDLGVDANGYGLRFVGASGALTIGRVEALAASEQVTVTGQPDVARNAIVQVSFNEAINPLSIKNSLAVRYDKAGSFDATAQTLDPEISNQYKAVELRSSQQCGVNSCGGVVYCWPTNDVIAGNPGDFAHKATHYQVEVKAPRLPTCQANNTAWCSDWGGTCEQTSSVGGRCGKQVSYTVSIPSPSGTTCTLNGGDWCSQKSGTCEAFENTTRCRLTINRQIYYNNVAADIANGGIVDMAGNAFNGSFNYYIDSQRNDKVTGIAEGESGDGTSLGQSGRPAYNLNERYEADTWYKPSTPKTGEGFGDTFNWNFYISDKIDIRPPLVSRIDPTTGEDVVDMKAPVSIVFNKIMRLATLRPGFNYGSDPISRSVRYILFNTITRSANPVGYWINSLGKDNNGDFFPDQTEAQVDHNRLDPAVLYSPETGSGLEDAYQNCLLPGAGPLNAGGGQCDYLDSKTLATGGCVSDSNITDHTPINGNNPASYHTLSCTQIIGANRCSKSFDLAGKQISGCKAPYATSTESADGSWIVTSDFRNYGVGSSETQGCCLGVCTSGL